MVMSHILLQKPSQESKAKDHCEALKRRLALWHRGHILEIYEECCTIQKRLENSIPSNSTEAASKKFASLMKSGNVNGVVKLLTSNRVATVLALISNLGTTYFFYSFNYI